MANEQRIRRNSIVGTLTNDYAAAATTMVSDAFSEAPAISASQHMAFTIGVPGIDADGNLQVPEIIYITDGAAGATSRTVIRARESTTAQDWLAGAPVVHGPTAWDYPMWTGAGCTSDLLLTTSQQDVPNCSLTLSRPGTWLILGFFDFYSIASGSGDVIGVIDQDGTDRKSGFASTSTGTMRSGLSIFVQVHVAPTASSTVKLQASRSGGTSGVQASTHSRIDAIGPFGVNA